LLAAAIACSQTKSQLNAEKADREVTRLPPGDFPQLPPAIRHELSRRGCTIPQPSGEKIRRNVIKGAFTQPGQLDWAVLCSVHQTSAILVFPNASTTRIFELARREDKNELQELRPDGGPVLGYSRQIDPVGRHFILERYRAYGGPKPPPIDHQGINDAFIGKASEVYYFHRGRWRKLTGGD
jgi:hypothetical protein